MAEHDARLTDGQVLLGLALRRLRREHAQTLGAVAEATGTTVSYVSDLERGTKLPSLPVLLRLATHFGVLVTDLLSGYPFGSTHRPPAHRIAPPPDGRGRQQPSPRG